MIRLKLSWIGYLIVIAFCPVLQEIADARQLKLHDVFKREADADNESGNPIVKILTDAARLLPLERFDDDPYLLQSIDRINSITAYRSPIRLEGRESDIVYERQTNDKDQDVVVLKASEDKVFHIKSHKTKQTYVVLRRNPRSLTTAYYVSYAYVRNASTSDSHAVKAGDSLVTVEWDYWEDRTVKKPVLWTSCASTVLVPCGFNAAAFTSLGVPLTAAHAGSVGANATEAKGKDSSSGPKASPDAGDDKEFETDSADFYDDLSTDLVHGRKVGVGELHGTVGGTSGNIVCAAAGMWGGTCGGGKLKKTVVIKPAPPLHPMNMGPGPQPNIPQGPPERYLPIGTPGIPPLPDYMNPDTPNPTAGIFYPDNRQIPPVDGSMTPFGPGKPYLYQASDPNTFGPKLPPNKGTTGVYAPRGAPVSVHGIMLPVKPGMGIFVPDGMAYPGHYAPAGRQTPPVLAYVIPTFPGHPDVFVPDSDMTNPLRQLDQNAALPGTVTPDPPNIARIPVNPGRLIQNRLPCLFIPDALNPIRTTIMDDEPQKFPPQKGILIPGKPGLPDVFIPDNDPLVKSLKPPPQSTAIPEPGMDRAQGKHGTLVPGAPGVDPLFVPDEAGGIYHFGPSNPSNSPSDGVLIPGLPTCVNDYSPITEVPKLPPGASTTIPGQMSPKNNPKKQPLLGNLIDNGPKPPFPFLPNGVGTEGTLNPTQPPGPPHDGIWAPGPPHNPDEFIPKNSNECCKPTSGTFTPKGNPAGTVPIQIINPTRPGGNYPIVNGGPRPAPNMQPAPDPSGGPGRFVPDPTMSPHPPVPMNIVSPKPPVVGVPIDFGPPPHPSPYPGADPVRGTAEIPNLPPQKGKVIPPVAPGGPGKFIPDAPGSSPGTFTPFQPAGSQPNPGFIGPPSPPIVGQTTYFTPDHPPNIPNVNTPGTLAMPGSQPLKGLLNPSDPNAPPPPPGFSPKRLFTPFPPSTFIPEKNPTGPVQGSTPPNVNIPNGDPKQEVPFHLDNPQQVPPGTPPQRGTLKRPGNPDASGILKPPPAPGQPATFVPDPLHSKPCTLYPNNNMMAAVEGACIMPQTPNEPVVVKPDDINRVPPGNLPGKLSVPSNQPPLLQGEIENPNPNPAQPATVLFKPYKPAIFTPATPPGAPPIPGVKQDPTGPGAGPGGGYGPSPGSGQPLKFYPDDPSRLTQSPQPGTLSAPNDPAFQPVSGMLRPDSPPPAYVFTPFPQGTFTPDGGAPSPGGVMVPSYPGEDPTFTANNPQSVPPGPTVGNLESQPGYPKTHGTLQPSPNPPNGPRPFKAFPTGGWLPDSNPNIEQPVSLSQPTKPGGANYGPRPGGGGGPNYGPDGDMILNPEDGGGGPNYGPPGGPGTGPGGGGPTYGPPGGPGTGPGGGGGPTYGPPGGPGTGPGGAGPTYGPPGGPGTGPGGGPNYGPNYGPGTGPGGGGPSGPTEVRPKDQRPLDAGPGTLRSPGRPDQHGTLNPPAAPQGPYTFVPDPPGSRPAKFIPENGGPPVQGTYQEQPTPLFTPSQPTQPQRGTLQPTQPPGAPGQTGELGPGGGPGSAMPWKPDQTFTWFPTSPAGAPVTGTSPGFKPNDDSTVFYPNNPTSMIPTSEGNLVSPTGGEVGGTMTPNPTPTPKPSWVFRKRQPDSSFAPDNNPANVIPGNTKPAAYEGAPIPFYPANKPVPPGSPGPGVPGTLQQPNQPPKSGEMMPPVVPGSPHTFQERPPSLFHKDSDPNTAIPGNADWPNEQPPKVIPFGPKNPQQLSPMESVPGVLKSPGHGDIHGLMEPPDGPGRKHRFVPDPPGSQPATFFPDTAPSSGVDGILSPGNPPPPTFRPSSDPYNQVPALNQQPTHGKMVPKGGDQPEYGTLQPAGPGGGGPGGGGKGPFKWIADPEGATPAWFNPDDGSPAVRGTYYPTDDPNVAEFKPTNPATAPQRDTHGKMKKENPPQSLAEAGTLKPNPGGPGKNHLFYPDPFGGVPAVFYPDINGDKVSGTFFPPTQPDTPGTFKPKETETVPQLPSVGQMVPDGQTQQHGALTNAPAGINLPLFFSPDKDPPEWEVGLVPANPATLGANRPGQPSGNMGPQIRGIYYKTTITKQIFVSYTEIKGVYVVNGVGPTDPKIQCASAGFFPSGDGTATLTPSNFAEHCKLSLDNCLNNPRGVFYPAGVISAGMPGTITKVTTTYIFRSIETAQEGTWRSTTKESCFMYSEGGALVPYDKAVVDKLEAERNVPPGEPMKAFNFQGLKGEWNIFMELDGSKGKIFPEGKNGRTIVHGFLQLDSKLQAPANGLFTADDHAVLTSATMNGPIDVLFEQDSSPASHGVLPDNEIPGKLSPDSRPAKLDMILDEEPSFLFTFNNPGRKGKLTPGKKPSPGLNVFCFGLVSNSHTLTSTTRATAEMHQQTSIRGGGRSFGKPKSAASGRSVSVDTSMVTSENMPAAQALQQNFGAWLDKNVGKGGRGMSATETRTETFKETKTETRTEEIIETSEQVMSPQISTAQLEALAQSISAANGSSGAVMVPMIPVNINGTMMLVPMMTMPSLMAQQQGRGMSPQGGLAPMPAEVRDQVMAAGGRPMTPEETEKILTPDVMAQIQRMMENQGPQGRSFKRFTPSADKGESGDLFGTAYLSTTGSTVFVPDSGTSGTLFVQSPPEGKSVPATFFNVKDKLDKATVKSSELSSLTDVIKASTAPRGVFVPTGSNDEAGGIQISSLEIANDEVKLTIQLPGERGKVEVDKEGAEGTKAIALTPYEPGKEKSEPSVLGLHGTYYKLAPKDFFAPDFPATIGTFYPDGTGKASIRGNFYPPPSCGFPEIIWTEDNSYSTVLPIGQDVTIHGKFVPDETLGTSAPESSGGIPGTLRSWRYQNAYQFKPDNPGTAGILAKLREQAPKQAGRGFVDSTTMSFVADNFADIFEHPGWKTQFEIIVPNVTFKYENDIYSGFGNCPRISTTSPSVLQRSKADEAVIDFYLGLLRTYCLPSARKAVQLLIRDGYLRVHDKLITLSPDTKYLTMPKLSIRETERLSAAFELTAFTLTYADELKKGEQGNTAAKSPNGKQISRSTKFLLDMSLLELKLIYELSPIHAVRLSRSLIFSLSTALTKINQDLLAVRHCEQCSLDKEVLHNDAMQLMGVVQFIMHGLDSWKEGFCVRASYETFFNAHEKIIHKRVQANLKNLD